MITVQQVDELGERISRTLEVIGDLKGENSRLEGDNEAIRKDFDQLKAIIDQKEAEFAAKKGELDQKASELSDLKNRQQILEGKIVNMLSRMDNLDSTG